MHTEEASNFLSRWPEIAPKILKNATCICKNPALKNFLDDSAGEIPFY